MKNAWCISTHISYISNTCMHSNVDIDSIAKDFNNNLDNVLSHYKVHGDELKDLVQFMHFIICRHIIQRKELGMLDYTLDEKNKIVRIKTLNKDTTELMKECLRDIDFSPFYYKMWAESNPVAIPTFKSLDGKEITKLEKILNSPPGVLETTANDESMNFLHIKDNKVYFEQARFSDFREWINSFNELFTEAGNLAVFITENDYHYDLDGNNDLGSIIMTIYKDTEKIYNELLRSDDEVKNFPSEMKEVMSFIYMITASKTFLQGQGDGRPVS